MKNKHVAIHSYKQKGEVIRLLPFFMFNISFNLLDFQFFGCKDRVIQKFQHRHTETAGNHHDRVQLNAAIFGAHDAVHCTVLDAGILLQTILRHLTLR